MGACVIQKRREEPPADIVYVIGGGYGKRWIQSDAAPGLPRYNDIHDNRGYGDSAFMLMLAKRYVPVETVRHNTDTLRLTALRVDSVFMHDSIAVMLRGDTVYITKYRDRFRYRTHTDTVYKSVIDTARISVPYPVERQLSRWEQTKMDFGGMAIGGIAIAVCIAVIWLIKKFRK